MKSHGLLIAGIGVAAAFYISCSKEKEKPAEGETATESAKTEASEPAPGTESGDMGNALKEGVTLIGERAEEKLLDAAVERRLYSDRIESSSFLWVNYNRFQENYHPNYIMDGDPTTAWIEGAEANGIGEWVRVKTSPVAQASKLRLRIQNGYHKTAKLHKQNARVEKLELKSLASGTSKVFSLSDDMEWQELSLDLQEERFEGFELSIVSAIDGTKYKDLCISDLEVYVTGKTPENPAFEAKKLEQLKAWKQSRLDAAKIFAGVAAKELPIHSAYRVKEGDAVSLEKNDAEFGAARAALKALRSQGAEHEAIFDRADAALAGKFKDWSHHGIVVKDAMTIPDVDGLEGQTTGSVVYGWPSRSFVLPALKGKSLVQAQRITLFETKRKNLHDGDHCRAGATHARRGPGEVGPNPKELLVWRCVEEEERDGVYTYLAWELYEFDDAGWLRLAIANRRAQYFDWKQGDEGVVLEGGARMSFWMKKVELLVASNEAPQ